MKKALVIAALLVAASAAGAQTVWRCGPDGRTYSDAPCPGGRSVDVADPRSAEQVAAAQAVAARQRQVVAALDREAAGRAKAERGRTTPAREAVRPKAPASKPAAKTSKKPPAADGTFRAVAPASRRTTG